MRYRNNRIFLTILLALTLVLSFSDISYSASNIPSTGKSLTDFVPTGWKLLTEVKGNFNKDKLVDLAAIIEEDKKWEIGDYAPERILLIVFKQNDGGYKLNLSSSKAIMKKDEGGVWGDPLQDISYQNGVLNLNFYGGSNYRLAYDYKFRYQNNGWYLIGATIDNFYTGTGEGTREDYNLLTGKMISSSTLSGKIQKEKTVNRGKKKLVNLKDFDVHCFDDFYGTAASAAISNFENPSILDIGAGTGLFSSFLKCFSLLKSGGVFINADQVLGESPFAVMVGRKE